MLNTHMEIYLYIFLPIINIFSFILYGLDKTRAKRKAWRISEGTLLLVSVLGGGVGSLMGMVVFKHKLSKKKFYLGIPCILVLTKIIELVVLAYIKK